MSSGLTSLETYAFENCQKLESIVITDGVTSIGDSTFRNCTSLKTVSIGSGCKSISATAFLDSTALEEIAVSNDNAAYSSVDGALFNKDKTSIVLYPKSKVGDFVIPDTVTSITNRAFEKCPNLTGITIGKGVKTVGDSAFQNCAALKSVKFEDSDDKTTSIGNYAFYNCQALSSVDFGNSVKTIGEFAFALTKSIETIEFPDSLESIGNYAFTPYSYGYASSYATYVASGLKTVKYGTGLKTIGDGAFYRNYNLISVEFTGSDITSIGSSAFYNCTGLTELSLTGNNATIGNNAFQSCTSLKDVTIGTGIKTIGNGAFGDCTKLETVNLSNDVQTIRDSAFRNCSALTSINTGNGLTSLGAYVFNNCSKLESIVIPDGVTSIGDGAFQFCSSLNTIHIGSGCKSISATAFLMSPNIEKITVVEDNTAFTSADNVLFNKDRTTLVLYPTGVSGDYVIPDTVTSIASYAFADSYSLTGIIIGKNVQTIGSFAFSGNKVLASVKFKDSNEINRTIGDFAFLNCQALSVVDFSNSNVKTIGDYAFALSKSLETVEFPDSLESIGDYAFTPYRYGASGDYVASGIKSVTFGTGLKTIGTGAFYKNFNLASIIFNGGELRSIGDSAFYNCTGLTELNLTGNSAVLGQWSFHSCTSLRSATIGKGVNKLDWQTFYYCKNLETVNLSNDVQTIGGYVFYDCSSLSTIVLGKGITSIGTEAFKGYSNLTVYCYEDTYAHTYATSMSNVDIKFVRDNYYVVDLKLSGISSSSAKISWKKPNGYDAIDHYIIYKNGVKYDETSDTSYTDINLESGSEYVYGVYAVDKDGVISEEKTITVTPACTSVKSITLPNDSSEIGGIKGIKLTGTMENSLSKSGGSAKFLYSADGKEWQNACAASAQANGVDYVGNWSLENVKTGEYTLRFVFTDKYGGQSYKDTTVNVDRTHPAAIDEITIIPTETSIKLSWQISVEYDTNIYRIYRRSENETKFELISEIRNRNTLEYTDSKVEDGLTYYYYVVGTDKYGQQSLTYDVVSAGIIDDAIPPQFIKMTPASNTTIYGNTTFAVTATDNVGIAKTELYYSVDPEAPVESWQLLDSHNGSMYSQSVDTSVMPSDTVYIKAKLYDAVGNSSYSVSYKYLCDNEGPEKVKNVQCIAIDGTIATLSWDDVSDKDISYFVIEQKNADGSWSTASITGATLGINLNGLVPETSYTYRVIGYDTHKNRGTASDEITITTLKDTLCPKVTKLTPVPGYYKSSIPLQFTATDDYKVTSIDVQTSTDKQKWETVSKLKSDKQSASCTLSYTLDVSEYDEGSLYVRGIVTDSYGNKTADEDATCYEYVIDRTAPDVPSGITADSAESDNSSSFVCIAWDANTGDNSFSYYRVYRSISEDGEYTLIKDKLTTVNTYDTSVEFGATYYYKVESVDLAGNISEKSAAVSCKVKDDTEAPVILPISPVDGTRISSNNNSITIAASDNAKLNNLKIEYKTNALFSGYKTLREVTDNSKNNCSVTVSLPVEELNSGTEVTVRVTASDSTGNEAEEKTITYVIDKDAPEVKDISLSKTEDNVFTTKWTTDADDTSYFYIYRKKSSDSSFILYDSVMAVNGKSSYTYTDYEISVSDKNVQYRVEAHDVASNTSYADTETMSVSGTIKPTALINCQSTIVCGSEYMFDGSVSTDDGQIVSYSFDFGDATDIVTNTDGKAKHVYTEKGKYTLTLQVIDNDGNASETKKIITVTSRELVGSVYVTVKDDNGNVLPNTDVYADLGEDNEQHAYTDSSGRASFELSVGTHIIASYKSNNYLPVKKSIAVTGGDTQLTLVLVNEPIVTGEFEIHKMTFDEIVAAGIDINAAENRNVVRIDVTLVYEKMPVQTVVYWNGVNAVAEPVYVKASNGTTRKLTPYVFGGTGVTSSSGGSGNNETINNPTIVYIDVPVEFSYLKEFFNVSLHIINHASDDFSLLDNTVKLNVPKGLTLVQTNSSEAKSTVYIDEIKGQSQKTINWVLRGDKPGSYEISADYLGMISYFNEPVSAKFVAEDKIEVHDASSISVEIEASETNYGGRVFYNTVIKNEGEFALDAFKWTPLVESFYDEYIDSNGNSSEMKKQRTTLAPGEKFVYHYFVDTGGMYEYIGNIVDDLNSFGAQVNVTIHEPKYFLDAFYEKFPEESGAYVFYVKDKNDKVIKNATVELSPGTSYTTDSEGRVIIEEEDRADIDCSYLKVTASGYYSYLDKSFKSVKFGKSTTVRLYKEGEFAVESVMVDGKDAIKYSTSIQTNKTGKDGNPATVTFISKVYGDIKSVDVLQDGKALKASSSSTSSLEHTYTTTYSADEFTEKEQVILRVIEDSGEEHTINLNINSVKLQLDPEINLPDSMTISLKDCSIDWLSDLDIDVAFSEYVKMSQIYNPDDQTVTFGINIGLGDDTNDYSLDTKFEDIVKEYKDAIDDMVDAKSFREGINSGSHDLELDLGFSLGGALVFNVNDDGSLGTIAKSKLFLGVSAGCEYSADFWIGYIPLTMSVGIGVGASAETTFVYNDTTYMLEFDSINLNLSLELELSLGIGISCCSFGAYGDAGISTDIVIDKSLYVDNVTLSGSFGLYVKFFFYSEKFPIVSGSTTLYQHKSSKSKSLGEMIAAAYDADSYSINDDLLTYNSVWDSAVKAGERSSTLLENAYSGSAPQFAVCGDKIVMVYQGVDSSADCVANALTLYYSVYDTSSNSWSIPAMLDGNKNADMAYSLTVCNDKIYVVYTQSNKSLSDDMSMSEALKNIDVYSAVFNSSTNTFGSIARISNNDSYDATPVVKNIGGVPTAMWINNTSNNPFITDDKNSIMISRYVNGVWTNAEAVVSDISTPVNCELLEALNNGVIVYTTDSDCDLATTEDRTIIAYNINEGSSKTLAEGVETAVETGTVLENYVAMWYENGCLMQYDAESGLVSELCNASSSLAKGFEIVYDDSGNYAIVYVEEGSSVCALYLDTVSGEWSAPVTIASSDDNIENLEAEYIEDKLTLTYYDTKVTNAETMKTESKLVTITVGNIPKPEITSADVELDKLVNDEISEISVNVTNNSSEPTGNLTFNVLGYDGSVIGTYTTNNVSLTAGKSGKYKVPFRVPNVIYNRDIKVTVTDSKNTSVSSYNINLAYTDMTVSAEQYRFEGQDFIKAKIVNNLCYASSATLEVYNRDTNEVLYTTNVSSVSKDKFATLIIPLKSEYIDDNGYVSVRVSSKSKDYCDYNNSDMFIYFNESKFDNLDLIIGDVNNDGAITIDDVTIIQKYIASLIDLGESQVDLADVNCDGKISIIDATTIQYYLSGISEKSGYCGEPYDKVRNLPLVNLN